MTIKMGRYRYWGDQKPDTSRPLLSFTRADAVTAKAQPAAADSPVNNATLRIYGPIDSWGGYWGVSAKEVAQALDLLGDADQVVVRINSPGGESSEGRAIMNLLRAHKAKCIGVVDGAAYSAASYIAVGCDETVMSPGTTLMIHDTHALMYGDAAAFRKEAEILEQISLSGAELYAEVAGGTVEQWRELQRTETWYTAASAVEAGLADRVAVVPDAGPSETAGDDGPEPVEADVEERARASYDLSLFDKAPTWAAPKPPTVSADGKTQPEGAAVVDLNDEQITALREQVGFPADADADTIVAAVQEALAERAEPPKDKGPVVPEGMVLVDAEVLAELKGGAAAGQTAAKELADQKRDRAIQDAIAAGKTTPARRDHWAKAWDADPEGTAKMLDSLEAGLVPIEEKGHAQDGDAETTLSPQDAAEIDNFLSGFGLSKEDIDG